MSKRLLTAYAMTAMFLLGGLVRQAAAQFSAPRCPAEKFTPVREQTTGSLIFGVGVNSDAGLTGSIVLNERKLDVTRSCEQDADVSVEVRLISLSATYYERLSKDILRKLVAGGEQPLSPGDAPSRVRFAFLNDAQVNRLLDVTQADPRTKVRQTPKNALGNGQVSTLGIMEQHFFLTGAYATTKGDQVVLLPHNEPLSTGLQLCMQPTVSTDRRSVRLKLKASQTELSSAKVRQFPVTVPITP